MTVFWYPLWLLKFYFAYVSLSIVFPFWTWAKSIMIHLPYNTNWILVTVTFASLRWRNFPNPFQSIHPLASCWWSMLVKITYCYHFNNCRRVQQYMFFLLLITFYCLLSVFVKVLFISILSASVPHRSDRLSLGRNGPQDIVEPRPHLLPGPRTHAHTAPPFPK